jgi:hypothetical protein
MNNYNNNNNYDNNNYNNNNYIINEYNIIYNNVIYNNNIYYNDSVTMVRNNMNQIYNNSEEFMQEQEHMIQLQEYDNELILQQELRIQNQEIEESILHQRELYINEFTTVIEIEEMENLDNERINLYLRDGEELIETCSICLDDVEHIESTSKLSCGHHFHTSCIRLCLQRSIKCPLCRQYCFIVDNIV